ncbi:hypothetical protein [Streptomyces sp. NPDC015350]|uniref:hypothetical protein n=1 Tax=Streptomyces sp. NPDC015350 TaxID=3364955 RepID=UPI00370328EC
MDDHLSTAHLHVVDRDRDKDWCNFPEQGTACGLHRNLPAGDRGAGYHEVSATAGVVEEQVVRLDADEYGSPQDRGPPVLI